ncbi:uncharacterized protein LOC113014002 isoform X1 [Astatotilapia calliptera]|uniref:uncharacterized protein LOC113014002 isoform X1 n=1 Tax=Astatotilapia calliptera TaxID=8154 RepID=UPI000E42C63B|nr:uncharacterized protein LOC113014002 isoform X1 [Astatotilapia calliptera]
MKVCHILFYVIFLNLQDGNTGLANAETLVYEGVEGGNITVECKFYILGRKTLFCKDKCETGNILIETADYTAQRGRYSIKYEKKIFSKDIVHASITQLNKSDSGRYSCTLDTSFQPCDFQLVITGASDTPTPHEPLSTSTFLLSASTTTTTHFSSGSFTPSSTSPETPSSGSDKMLYMILTLVLVIIVLSATLLIFYKNRKAIKPKGPPVETEYANITRAKQEIREGAPQRKVEVSSIYTTAKGPQPDGAENIDLYNLTTCSQNKAEDDMNKVNYAEVDFSNIPATNNTSCSKTDEVVYSTPLVHTSPSNLTTDASPPLYSAVKKQY